MAEKGDEYVTDVRRVDIAPRNARDQRKELCNFGLFEVHLH